MNKPEPHRITLIGAGTIGLAFAAFHLQHSHSPATLTIYDVRDDLDHHVQSNLPKFLDPSHHGLMQNVRVTKDLTAAVKDANIVQEQGPENPDFKQSMWERIEGIAPSDALFWSSTSGIPASKQALRMKDKSRLIVVHPYNPPHVMPLLEVVPSPSTSDAIVQRTLEFWKSRGRSPVVIKKECTGFVANRLAFALLRESINLVKEGVVTVEELDRIVETSMGPRWAVWGPFKSYHAGGGPGGLEGFFKNIGGSVQDCWDDAGQANVGGDWERKIFDQARDAYGAIDIGHRDALTREVLEVTQK